MKCNKTKHNTMRYPCTTGALAPAFHVVSGLSSVAIWTPMKKKINLMLLHKEAAVVLSDDHVMLVRDDDSFVFMSTCYTWKEC